MNTKLLNLFAVIATICLLNSCQLDPYELPADELYTRSFIKTFGLIDPQQDWNMAKEAEITVNVGDKPSHVKVYVKSGEKYYLVADLDNVSGSVKIPLDIPKDSKDLYVKINDNGYYTTVDGYAQSRTLLSDLGTNLGGYTVRTSRPDNPEIFNSLQLSPIINKNEWVDYYSLNSNTYRYNNPLGDYLTPATTAAEIAAKENGLIPEGTNNRGNQNIIEDYKVLPGDDGEFTIYPMYWNTARNHTLGIYLIDDNGDPIKDNSGKILRFPVYKDKEGNDLQKNSGMTAPTGGGGGSSWPKDDAYAWLNGIPSSLQTVWPDQESFYDEEEGIQTFNDTKFADFETAVKNLWNTNPSDVALNNAVNSEQYDLDNLEFDGNYYYFSCKAIFTPKPEPSTTPGEGGTVSVPYKLQENPSGWSDCTENPAFGYGVNGLTSDQEYLVKSLGVTITITDGNGNPYTGWVGMYIEFDDQSSYNGAGNKDDQNLYNTDKNYGDGANSRHPYIFYSQSKLNTHNYPKGVSYACTFKHPVSGRVFTSFEDWPEHSDSDADLNDLVFLMSGIEDAGNENKTLIEREHDFVESGFQWLVAAEDLGTTDDFDFNDVIFGINVVTTNYKETKTYKNGEEVISTETTETINKKITVQALAAGGTLETYLHYYDGTNDYILGPNNTYVDNTGGDGSRNLDEFEWHYWFGSRTYNMINTGLSTVSKPGKCLFVNKTTTTTSTGSSEGSTSSEITTEGTPIDGTYLEVSGDFSVSGYSKVLEDGRIRGFYITVGTSADGSKMNTYIGDGVVIAQPNRGAAPQMFLIADQGHISGKGWYWPEERQHIYDSYTSFKDWIGDSNNTNWHKPSTTPEKVLRPVAF